MAAEFFRLHGLTDAEVLEGVREAEHERMLLSRQDEEEAEGEDLVPLEAEDDEQP